MSFRRNIGRAKVLVASGLLLGLCWRGAPAAPPPVANARKAAVSLIPSVSAVVPGASFDVAISYKLAEEWHIYWKNPGESGKPPVVKWHLPTGFEAGELRFPAPHRLETGPADFRIVTYVHEGEPVLLATLTAPSELAPGGQITVAATVNTLVCKGKCIPEVQKVSFALPVVADASSVEPANRELLERAAQRIPPEDGRGKFITVSASPSVESVEIGDTFEVSVAVDIKAGYHIQSNRPYIPTLIRTEAVPEPLIGVEFDDALYPEAREKLDKALGMKLSEFYGRPVISVPVEVTDEAVGTSLDLAGIVIAQACADKTGRCYAPEAVAWAASVALTGAPSAATATSDGGMVGEATQPTPATESSMSLPIMLLLALLGGVILNVMPCVWPVLSIKVLSFVQQAHDDPKRVLRLGLLFAFGILVSFWLLGLVAVAGKAAAGGATWGTQFSNPTFVIVMAVILFVFGLSLFGIFEFNLPGAAAGTLSAAATREGYAGSFLKGMMATVLATPCTAPLLGPAIAVAFTQSGTVIMLAMSAIGVGMGLPYVVLAAKPAWLRFLPKPGPWMDTFKQFTGFLLVGVVIWLLWVLGHLIGHSGVVATVAFLTFLGLACWVYGKISLTWSSA
ncbi:MAG: cytochrome c biogenesis protein CcdA, partial [Planctomycetota bacterium]